MSSPKPFDPSSSLLSLSATKPTFTTDQIIYQITTSWGGSSAGDTFNWDSSLISFSINSGTPTNVSGYTPSEGGSYLVNMDPLQVATAQLSFQLWDDVIAKSAGTHRLIQSISPSANITFDYSNNTSGNGTYADFWTSSFNPSTNNGTISASQIWLSSNWTSNGDSGMVLGGYGLLTMIHEIGHSIGLSHPGTYDASYGNPTYATDAVFAQDNRKYTVMSYFGGYLPGSGWQQDGTYLNYIYPQTFMVYDIAAIQAKYGADTMTRTGDTIYGFNCNLLASDSEKQIYDFNQNHTPIFTIWDAGGTDTLDCSGYAGSQTINLTPGSYSSVDGMIENVAIALNCFIEKAIGGAGNDTLIAVGNNTLTGGAGADTFNITLGTNTITDLGNGADILTVSPGAIVWATAYGNVTATSSTINNGTAYINANGHTVDLASAGGSNGWTMYNTSPTGVTLVGSAHNDTIYGGWAAGMGNDTLTGGAGADMFSILSGTNTITDLGNGVDILTVSPGAIAWATAYGNYTATSSTISNGLPLINANGYNVSFASAGGSNGWTLYNTSPTGISLVGSAHNDTIYGGWAAGTGNDTLTGGAGADTFSILSGTNTVTDLGNGADILTVSPGAIAWATAYGTFTATSSTISNALPLINANGYNVSFASAGGSNGWTLYNTSPTGVTLVGSAHNDTIYGGWGAGTGNDTLTGGGGADTFSILSGTNTITDLGNGTDILNVASGAIVWATAYGNLTATSSTISNGIALINANGHNVSCASAGVWGLGWTIYNTSPTGVTLVGSTHNDTIYGGWGLGAGTSNDTLTGGGGDDTFSILSATNTITDLGNGADILTVSPGAIVWATAYGNVTATSSTINNGTAYINANGHDVSFYLAGGANGWTMYNISTTGVALVGSAHNDTIYGGWGFGAGTGNDILTGAAGDDTFFILSGTHIIADLNYGVDMLNVSSGATALATVYGNFAATSSTINNGTALINAVGHNVSLASAGGVNGWSIANSSPTGVTLEGSNHNDIISGGTGNDTLTGGGGIDHFVFDTAPNTATNHDTIIDFVHGLDFLVVSKAIFSTITTWASNEFYAAPGAITGHISTDRIVYDTTTGNLYYDADGSGSGAAVLVALIGTTTHPTLDWNDIQLVA